MAPPPKDLIAGTFDILRRHGDKLPRRKNTLFNAIKVEVPELTADQFGTLLDAPLSHGIAVMTGAEVTYPALAGEAQPFAQGADAQWAGTWAAERPVSSSSPRPKCHPAEVRLARTLGRTGRFALSRRRGCLP